MTTDSTKLPVLFLDHLMGVWYFIDNVSGIDTLKQCKAEDYLNSLSKVKYFPNETYVFPSKTVNEEDLQFAKAIGVNPLI